ncbi:DUF3135 domain-containing protein [Vibrio sp. 99-8-1]|uniref:DUF3135 domain-containing protein n=1 Tax=Vibrio sp. 99-8-1 TaxID=2607602 RepID=UPI001493BF69|nr:DUF3135 domain-containing protein [Vibrio sp. 99-8-1]NOI67478.1 DUF3135 domain-containing protein [Vibrio sp. 99-8-1]
MGTLDDDSKTKLPSFDELVNLARENPDRFDQLKQSLCDDLIASSHTDNQPRLRAQQSHIDRLISKGKNANHVNVLLYKELMKQLGRFKQSLLSSSETTKDNVLSFTAKNKTD